MVRPLLAIIGAGLAMLASVFGVTFLSLWLLLQ